MSDNIARIDRYYEDACQLTSQVPSTDQKMISEIKKLRQWIQRHQSETVPDSSKIKLLSVIQTYFKFYSKREISTFDDELGDIIHGAVSDILRIPEGKLTNSKHKSKALKWLETISTSSSSSSLPSSPRRLPRTESKIKRYVVAEINDSGKLVLMGDEPDDSGDLIEGYVVDDKDLLASIIDGFEGEAPIYLDLDDIHNIVGTNLHNFNFEANIY